MKLVREHINEVVEDIKPISYKFNFIVNIDEDYSKRRRVIKFIDQDNKNKIRYHWHESSGNLYYIERCDEQRKNIFLGKFYNLTDVKVEIFNHNKNIKENLLTENIKYNYELELLLESENIVSIENKLKEKVRTLNQNQTKEFLKYWLEKAEKLTGKIKIIFISLLVTVCLSKLPADYIVNTNFKTEETKHIVMNVVNKSKSKKIEHNIYDNKEFLDAIAKSESSNNWKTAKRGYSSSGNILDYVGKYQFGYYAFKDIGKKQITYDQFKKNPNIYPETEQDKDMLKLLKKNKHHLRNYLHFIGKKIKGIYITESGLLAAAHLVGNKSVKDYLNSNGKIDAKDGNGIKCSDYIKKFSGYKIKI